MSTVSDEKAIFCFTHTTNMTHTNICSSFIGLSVNDAFVMRQWGLHQGLTEDKTVGSLGFEKVKLLPDGAAAFTRGMGMSTLW